MMHAGTMLEGTKGMFNPCAAFSHTVWRLCHSLFMAFDHGFMLPAFHVFVDGFFSRWINDLVQRRNVSIPAVAVANQNARIAWALLARAEVYRTPVPASV